MINWINSWKKGNKKEKYNIEIRLGRLTLLEVNLCLCAVAECSKFRLIVFNFGFEL
jgi:ABC-type uncharacterized transport system YnjBCD substrate-binding protein